MTLVIGFSFGHGEGAGGDEGVMVWCETCSTAPDSTGVSRASVRDVSARNRTARVWHDGRPSLCYSPATDEVTAGRGDRARADSVQGDTRLRAQGHRGQAVVAVRCIRALTRWAVLWPCPHRHACVTLPGESHSPRCVSQCSACVPGPGLWSRARRRRRARPHRCRSAQHPRHCRLGSRELLRVSRLHRRRLWCLSLLRRRRLHFRPQLRLATCSPQSRLLQLLRRSVKPLAPPD